MTDEAPPWLRDQLYEISVMLRTLISLAKLDSDIRVMAPAPAPAAPSEADSADVTDGEQAAA